MKDILEIAATYWNEFSAIYDTVLRYGAWKTITILTPSLLAIGIVRSAYNYAKGNVIGDFNYGMFFLRFLDYLATLLGMQDETAFREKSGWDDDRNRKYKLIPIGSSLIGVVLDVAAFTVLTLVALLIWPVVTLICVTVGPLHVCRVHNLRKKAFIANLKGEEVEA